MKILSDRKYQELTDLVEQAKIRSSLEKITRLEDDIDLPIKRCVMMAALLGFEPTFSCCGYDYVGQPYHKHHQYGEPYIQFHLNEINKAVLISKDSHLPYGWQIKFINRDYFCLVLQLKMNPHWRDKNCIHFSEECNIAISTLENFLLSMRDSFQKCVCLVDTNIMERRYLKFWQYTPKTEWNINREDINL